MAMAQNLPELEGSTDHQSLEPNFQPGNNADTLLLERTAALPRTLCHRIVATAEALHILDPYCQYPIDCRLLAQRQRQASALGRTQRTLARAAPYCALLDLEALQKTGQLVGCLEWLLQQPSIATVRLAGDLKEVQLSWQAAVLLGRLLQAQGPASGTCRPIKALNIHTMELGQRFDAGMLAPFRSLESLELCWFTSADLEQLPRSVHSVSMVLPGASYVKARLMQELGSLQAAAAAGAGAADTTAAAAAAAEGAAAAPAAAAAAAAGTGVGPAAAAADAGTVAVADAGLDAGADPAGQPAVPAAGEPAGAAGVQLSAAPGAALPPAAAAPPPATAAIPEPGPDEAGFGGPAAAGAAAAAAAADGMQGGQQAQQAAVAPPAPPAAAPPAEAAPAVNPPGAAAAAGAAAPAAAQQVAQLEVLLEANQEQLSILADQLLADVLSLRPLHPIAQPPRFRLAKLEMDGNGLDVSVDIAQLFCSADVLMVAASTVHLQAPASPPGGRRQAQQQQQQQQAIAQQLRRRRRPWWRFWRGAPPCDGLQGAAGQRLLAVLSAFQATADYGAYVHIFARQLELGQGSTTGGGAGAAAALAAGPQLTAPPSAAEHEWQQHALHHAQQWLVQQRQPSSVSVTAEQLRLLLRRDLPRLPGLTTLAMNLRMPGSGICLQLVRHRENASMLQRQASAKDAAIVFLIAACYIGSMLHGTIRKLF